MRGKIQKPCRVCGKLFTPCADCENDKTMFRWKRIACSQKCAKEYFAKVEASRQPKAESADLQPVITDDLETTDIVSKVTLKQAESKRTRKKNDSKNKESEQID